MPLSNAGAVSPSIRKLVSSDASEFRRIRLLATQTDPESIYPSHDEMLALPLEDFTKAIAQSAGAATYGAFLDDGLVAIAGLRTYSMAKVRHRAEIWGVYTDVQHRGRGMAGKLLARLLADVRTTSDISALSLLVYSRNTAAKALYSRFGFNTVALQAKSMLLNGRYLDEERMELSISGASGAA